MWRLPKCTCCSYRLDVCQLFHVQRGLKAHLLLHGEPPQILTGYNLNSMLYGNVTYVPGSFYANREEMLLSHADSIGGTIVCLDDLLQASFTSHNSMKSNSPNIENVQNSSSKKILIVSEGAGDAIALPMFTVVCRFGI